MNWQKLILRTTGGREHTTSVLLSGQHDNPAHETNEFLDLWMRAKLFPQSIKAENWRTFCVWSADSVLFLGDVESVEIAEKVPV